MAQIERETGRAARSSKGPLIGTYLAAAVLGAALGAGGLLPFGGAGAGASTPRARVGFALALGERAQAKTSPASWTALRSDLDAVAATAPARDTFELLVALRGLASGGETDWNRAEQLCRQLNWPRCDRPALEAMKRRSQP